MERDLEFRLMKKPHCRSLPLVGMTILFLGPDDSIWVLEYLGPGNGYGFAWARKKVRSEALWEVT
jgi:hypothetical protein